MSKKKIFQGLKFPILFFVICLTLFFIPIIILIILKFSNFISWYGGNDNNNIKLPKGYSLHELNQLTLINHEIGRIKTRYLIAGNNNIDRELSLGVNEEGNVNVDFVFHDEKVNEDEMMKVNCFGTCNCYVDDENGLLRRNYVSNLVYSYRYSSVVVVSILGYALAKFTDDKVNECYENAKNILTGQDNDEFIDSLTCSMQESDCDTDKAIDDYDEKEEGGNVDFYECTGYCVVKIREEEYFNRQPDALTAIKEVNCEEKRGPKKSIRVNYREPQVLENGKTKYFHHANRAVVKYRKFFLSPFCKSFVVKYKYYLESTGSYKWLTLQPCSATHNFHRGYDTLRKNVNCKRIYS